MSISRGNQLAQDIRLKAAALKQVYNGVDEGLASRAPADRWTPKQILSHLNGPGDAGFLPMLKAFVEGDIPMMNLEIGDPFYTVARARMSFGELVAMCEENYEGVAEFAAGLTDEQLARTAHIPELKDSPLGEYPTLEGMIGGLGDYHLQFHIDHLREVLAALSSSDIAA